METKTFLMVSYAMMLSFLAAGLLISSSFAQENQTNMTTTSNETGSMIGNQTESGTASGIENLTGGTSGNTGLLQNDTNIGSQNTSVTGGMEQEQEATETSNMTSQQQNQTGGGQQNQTEGGKDALGQIGESIGNIFGQ